MDVNEKRHRLYDLTHNRRTPDIKVQRHNQWALGEIQRLQEIRRKRILTEKEQKQEQILSDAMGHFLKRTPDNREDANKRVDEIIRANA